MGVAPADHADGDGHKVSTVEVSSSRVLRDFFAATLLAATLLAVHIADGRFTGGNRQTSPPADDPRPIDAPATAVAPREMGPTVPPDQEAPSTAEVDSDEQDSRMIRGIIADFEPYVPRIIDEPPPAERNFVEPPPPEPPKLVETPAEPAREPNTVEFFDTETEAASVGFVVDCSSSMQGPKFQAVCNELAHSILNLDRKQEFFVVFFNDNFFPMSGATANPRLVPADLTNKRAIVDFLRTARAEGGTDPEPALRFIAELSPDVVYLLTDGEFNPLSATTYTQLAKHGIVVHTIGFELGGRSANLEQIAKRTAGTYREASKDGMFRGLLLANPGEIRVALRSPDKAVRREAVEAALLRDLPFVDELIDMLSDPNVRDVVHDGLRSIADGSDFGPRTPDETSAATARWKMWQKMRTARGMTNRVLADLASEDLDTVWVAAVIARTSGLDAPDALIAALRRAPSPIWQELHAAIVRCCAGAGDLGPAHPSATPQQVAEAADRWAAWRKAEAEKEIRARFEKKCKAAAEVLRLTRLFLDTKPDVVERRCEEIIRDYGDTPAAEEARQLLGALRRGERID